MPIDDADLEFDLFPSKSTPAAAGDADRRIADEDNLRDGHRGGLSRGQQTRRAAERKGRR
jgi:hypothetical protein